MAEQTRPVDLLGLIDREIEVLRGSCENDPDPDNLIAEAMNDWRAARAAFAELVEAATEIRRVVIADDWPTDDMWGRLDAALAALNSGATP